MTKHNVRLESRYIVVSLFTISKILYQVALKFVTSTKHTAVMSCHIDIIFSPVLYKFRHICDAKYRHKANQGGSFLIDFTKFCEISTYKSIFKNGWGAYLQQSIVRRQRRRASK